MPSAKLYNAVDTYLGYIDGSSVYDGAGRRIGDLGGYSVSGDSITKNYDIGRLGYVSGSSVYREGRGRVGRVDPPGSTAGAAALLLFFT